MPLPYVVILISFYPLTIKKMENQPLIAKELIAIINFA